MKLVACALMVLVGASAYAQLKSSVSETPIQPTSAAKPAVAVGSDKKEAVGTFDKLWVRQITIVSAGTRLLCTVGAFDGTNTIGEADRRISVANADKDETLGKVITGLTAAVKAAAGKAVNPSVITVNARNAKSATNFVAVFPTADPAKPDVYQVRDLYAAGAPAAVKAEYEKVLAWVAALKAAK